MENNQTTQINQKEIEIHLKEYEALRAEIRGYIQRLDKYIGIYLAALFAIVAIFLRPGTEYNVALYLEKIERDPYSVGFILLIPILNSILQIHLISFMHTILAMAKYSSYIIGNRLSEIVGMNVLSWDKKFSIWDRGPEVTTRTIAGSLYSISVSSISLLILLVHSNIILLKRGQILFGLYFAGIILVSLSMACLIRYVLVSRKFHDFSLEKIPRIRWIFVVIFLLLIVIIIIFARNSG